MKDKAKNSNANAIVETKIKKEIVPKDGVMFLQISIFGVGALIIKEQVT